MKRTYLTAAATAFGMALTAQAGAAVLPVLTYNVRGLPPQVIEPRASEIAAISGKLEDFHTAAGEYAGTDSVVLLQELFYQDYYTTIMNGTAYDQETAKDTGGPALIGDGLNALSDFTFTGHNRVQWANCFGTQGANGSDCDTNKGFSVINVQVAPDLVVAVFNLHADAGQDEGSRTARRSNITQLATFINTEFPDDPIILMGDTNSLYTRSGNDNIETLLATGLKDVWVEMKRSGVVPGAGSPIDSGCAADEAGANCERIDKIMYRSGNGVLIEPTSYAVLDNLFDDAEGDDLSDHKPVTATFNVAQALASSTTSSTSTSSTTTSTTTTVPGGECGDPAPPKETVTASDALFVLRSAVGTLNCETCICDANGNGSVTASDALIVLKAAVGQSVSLNCPAC